MNDSSHASRTVVQAPSRRRWRLTTIAAGGAAAIAIMVALVWAVSSTASSDPASGGTTSGGTIRSAATEPSDPEASATSETSTGTNAPDAQQKRSGSGDEPGATGDAPRSDQLDVSVRFAQVTSPLVQELKADVGNVQAALETGEVMQPAIASLREHAISLRTATPPDERAAIWNARLEELDDWIAIAEAGANVHDSTRLGPALSNIKRVVTELESVAAPSP